MKIQINYGTAVATLPAAALGVMDRATVTDLKVLLLLSAEPSLLAGNSHGDCVTRISERAGCTASQTESALSFWRGAGLLTLSESGDVSTAPAVVCPAKETTASAPKVDTAEPPAQSEDTASCEPPAPKPQPVSSIPRYTRDELTALLEQREEVSAYLNECQNIWGKFFNTYEYNIILGLVDYLGLQWEYVLVLLSYAAKYYRERENVGKSLAYVENMAFALHKDGIVTPQALQQRIKEIEQMATYEYKLREMFGMGDGALTPTQKKHFSTWLYEYHYDLEIIRLAYNRAVDRTGSNKITKIMNYVGKTLAAWNDENLRTPEQIAAADAAFRAEKEGERAKSQQPSSFNTDDFFAAAVERSLGEDFDPDNIA